MKKKILFVITKSNWGGAQRYVYDLAVSLRNEYDVAVAFGGSGPLAEKLHAKGVRIIPIPFMERDINISKDSTTFFQLFRIFTREKPDIVHLNSSKAGGLGVLAARICRVPRVIFTAHGWAYNEPVSAPSKFFRWIISLITLLLSHRVITVSRFDEVHAPLGLETTTIHNGIEAPEFLTRDEAQRHMREYADIPHSSFIIGTVAELTKNKGVDTLIEAVALTKEVQLVVIGEGEDRMMLEALIKKHELGRRVHLVGFVDNAATVLKAFDIFILSSRKEGLPYTILEAGQAGIPVIASTVGGIPEIIDDQLSGVLVPPYDTQTLAEALGELVVSPRTRARYAEALKEKVEHDFSLEKMVQDTSALYEGTPTTS